MEKIKASLMTVAVVLALIAFIAPSSAYSLDKGYVECNEETMTTTWTFEVTCDKDDDPHAISNFMVAWCNKSAVEGVEVAGESTSWDYVTKYEGTEYEITGIKIDYTILKGDTVGVEITLDGCYLTSGGVKWVIKGGQVKTKGTVFGPVACNDPIPEFSTIAIPIASILGLLFFFNRRKRRKEE